jgi:hypothetical protein
MTANLVTLHTGIVHAASGSAPPLSEVNDLALELGMLNTIRNKSHNKGDHRSRYAEPNKEHPLDKRSERINLHAEPFLTSYRTVLIFS